MDIDKISCVFHKSVKFDSSKTDTNKINGESFQDVLKNQEEIYIERYAIPETEKDAPPMLKYAVPSYYEMEQNINKKPPYVPKYGVPRPKDIEIKGVETPPAPMYAVPDENTNK